MILKQLVMQCTIPAFGLTYEKTEIAFIWLQQ